MSKYSVLLQICAILFLLFLIYIVFKSILTLVKKNRLIYYSLDLEKSKYVNDTFVFKIIHKFSKFLSSMVVFNGVARTYDRYVTEKSKFKEGMDFVSTKIIIGMFFVFLYLFVSFLYRDGISSLLIITCFIIGFLIIDFYCLYLKSKNRRLLNKDVLEAVIIMNNSFKANRSIEQAILDVIARTEGIVKKEFKKILNDIKLGLNVDEAFRRMYLRTHIKTIQDIAIILSLLVKTGANKVIVFEEIEKKMLEEERFINEVTIVKKTNKLAMVVFILMPLVFLSYTIVYNEKYLRLLLEGTGVIVILVLAIIYILYILVMFKVAKGDKYVK